MTILPRSKIPSLFYLQFAAGLALVFGLFSLTGCSSPPSVAAAADRTWLDAWGVSFLSTTVNGQLRPVPTFDNQTVRMTVFTKLGGSQVRVKFSNKFQTVPLAIGGASIALRTGPGSIDPSSARPLTFSGQKSVIVP